MELKKDFTVAAIVIGVILSLLMAAANMYLGLKGGMTISANIPCSVIAVIIFNKLLRNRGIAEINVAQATGSVGEGLAAGVVFIFPALAFAHVFPTFSAWGWKEYFSVTCAILAGGLLGIVLTGFLRRPMVEEDKNLRFPEGVATAEILRTCTNAFQSGQKQGLEDLLFAFGLGVFTKICSAGISILQETSAFVYRIKNSVFGFGSDLSAAMLGVGFIIEFEGAVMVAMGGALAWLIFIPIYTNNIAIMGDIASAANEIWVDQIRYIGVGGMIVGGMWSIFRIRKQMRDSIIMLWKIIFGKETSEDSTDLSPKQIWITIVFGFVLAGLVYWGTSTYVDNNNRYIPEVKKEASQTNGASSDSAVPEVKVISMPPETISISAAGAITSIVYTIVAIFLFVAISVYIVGLIGSTNQPVSGITICTFLLAAIFLLAVGQSGSGAVMNILLLSGVICLAVCLSGTASQNFKTASIVGGLPRSMQMGLLISVGITSLIAVPLLQFLDYAYKIGSDKLTAPQASMFAKLARGIFDNSAQLPWDMVGLGILIGIAIIIFGHKGGFSPMAISVGIYLPFTTTIPVLLGGIIHGIVRKQTKDESAFNDKVQKGTIFCSGLVAGEAITAVILASLIFAGKNLPIECITNETLRTYLSMGVLVALPIILYRKINAK